MWHQVYEWRLSKTKVTRPSRIITTVITITVMHCSVSRVRIVIGKAQKTIMSCYNHHNVVCTLMISHCSLLEPRSTGIGSKFTVNTIKIDTYTYPCYRATACLVSKASVARRILMSSSVNAISCLLTKRSALCSSHKKKNWCNWLQPLRVDQASLPYQASHIVWCYCCMVRLVRVRRVW